MNRFLPTILVIFLLFNESRLQKKIREKGESDYPYLVNMWIPKNLDINQEKPRFCDAIQLTPFTDYFFTSAKCFDSLEHDMWLDNIGISWDEHVVSYSRHMSFLTRFKEEGGHFVILERFETNPLDIHNKQIDTQQKEETVASTNKTAEIEEMINMLKTPAPREIGTYIKHKEIKRDRPKISHTTASEVKERMDVDYDDIPNDLAQYDDIENQYEINEQKITDEEYIKYLRSMRNKRIRLSTPDVKGASECYVLGWGSYLRNYDDMKDLEGLTLRKEMVRKLPRRLCRSSDPAHICVVKETEDRECVEDLGSPLICERKDAKNNTIGVALAGIYTGFKNCVTTDMGIYRSLSSELPWIARWAKGASITTSGFERRVARVEESHSPVSRRNSIWRRRGRFRSCANKKTVNCFLLLYAFIANIFVKFHQRYGIK